MDVPNELNIDCFMFADFANDEKFIASHLPPVPLDFTPKIGKMVSMKVSEGNANQLGLEVFAHLCGGFADDFNGAIAEDTSPVLCDKDQVHM